MEKYLEHVVVIGAGMIEDVQMRSRTGSGYSNSGRIVCIPSLHSTTVALRFLIIYKGNTPE